VSHFKVAIRPRNESGDWAIAELAERQHGRVAHRQLTALGLSPAGIQRRVRAARLRPVFRGVYAVGHVVPTARGRWMGAVLACGPGALLSHQTAAALWDLRPSSSPAIHVTTPGRGSPRGLRVHRVRGIDPRDRAEHESIPVTGIARTLVDLAEVLGKRQIIRAIEQAERLRVFDLTAITELLARSRGRHGARPLREAIAEVDGEPPFVNSDWERDLLDFCADHDIPKPELNVLVEDFLVDAFWRREELIIELDSWSHHRSRRAFEEDRRRDAILQLAQYRVLRITKLDDYAAELLSAAVAAR
jgi:hypothetical protein